MSDKERKEQYQALFDLSQTSDGRAYLAGLAADFDKAMQFLLYADSEEIFTAQGKAQALHEQLKKFDNARLAQERQ